ncbi:MAG: PIN domain-containing protein [Aeromicrobium sp.]|uniref:type II toxin-antitoxin system VapC family toxin n=1 Tax=Aeromicrobium sp. TaxID=1871063 RepID=UPI0039E6E2E6
MDAFDADVLIYASKEDRRGDLLVEALRSSMPQSSGAIGSVLLVTETQVPGVGEPYGPRLHRLLGRMRLLPVTREIAQVAATVRGCYRLKTPDAIHLATAIVAGADRFVTGNKRDFGPRIREMEIVIP